MLANKYANEPVDLGHVNMYQNDLFSPRLPLHRFKNIRVQIDPLWTTQHAAVHIPGL